MSHSCSEDHMAKINMEFKMPIKQQRTCFIPSRVSGRGYKIGPVCLSVCLLVSSLTAEPFDVWTQDLV